MHDRYRRIFRECFNFLLANADDMPDEEYWVRIAEEIGKVCGSLSNDPLAVDLLAAVYAELERCGNERQAKG